MVAHAQQGRIKRCDPIQTDRMFPDGNLQMIALFLDSLDAS
jgi:hypothetical protein